MQLVPCWPSRGLKQNSFVSCELPGLSVWDISQVFSTCDTLLPTDCSESDRGLAALPSVVLLAAAAAAGSKVYPGLLHVLMIDSSLAPHRDAYMRPENMEIGAQGVCIWVMNIYLYVRVLLLHKSCPVTCTRTVHVCLSRADLLFCNHYCTPLLNLNAWWSEINWSAVKGLLSEVRFWFDTVSNQEITLKYVVALYQWLDVVSQPC